MILFALIGVTALAVSKVEEERKSGTLKKYVTVKSRMLAHTR